MTASAFLSMAMKVRIRRSSQIFNRIANSAFFLSYIWMDSIKLLSTKARHLQSFKWFRIWRSQSSRFFSSLRFGIFGRCQSDNSAISTGFLVIEGEGGSTEKEGGDFRLYALQQALRVSDCFERGDLRPYILWRVLRVSLDCLLLLLRGASLATEFSWPRFRGRTHSAGSQKRYRDRRSLQESRETKLGAVEAHQGLITCRVAERCRTEQSCCYCCVLPAGLEVS